MADRYLKVVLTVIAIELAWLGVKDVGTPVAAQANTAPAKTKIHSSVGSCALPSGPAVAGSGGLVPAQHVDAAEVGAPRQLPLDGTDSNQLAEAVRVAAEATPGHSPNWIRELIETITTQPGGES